jgi:MoaA/NifB/PqqE/SkfB family radical SAM enzyme
MRKVPRIILNFNDRCLNGCPFCFIPFDGAGVGDVGLWREIIARANSFSPEMISFSGCDPFYYEDFYELLETAEKRCCWGVDTSLVWLNEEKFRSCCGRLEQISTSWDDVPAMPEVQRYGGERYARFVRNVEIVRERMPQLVVHTLFSSKNRDHLERIADELLKRQIRTWSIYQFWPFDFIKQSEEYITDPQDFRSRTDAVQDYVNGRLDLECVPCEGRANGYFFVSSRGTVYTTLGGPVGRYKVLGTIFDEDIFEKWQYWSNPAAAGAVLRKKLQRETGEYTENG